MGMGFQSVVRWNCRLDRIARLETKSIRNSASARHHCLSPAVAGSHELLGVSARSGLLPHRNSHFELPAGQGLFLAHTVDSALNRTIRSGNAVGRRPRGFDQQFPEEKIFKNFPLNYLHDLFGCVTGSEVHALADDIASIGV